MNILNKTAVINKSEYDLISRKATGFIYQEIEGGITAVLNVLPRSAVMHRALQFQEFILELIENGKKKIIIDLSSCDYIDISFLGTMVIAQKRLYSVGGILAIVIPPHNNIPVLKSTDIKKIFRIYKNLTEAITNME